MDQLTRRRFLGWTSAGAAGAGLLAVMPRIGSQITPGQLGLGQAAANSAASAPTSTASTGMGLPAFAEPIVAYVHNAASGELSLMVGTQEMTIHDPDLVARLFQRAGSGR